MKTTKFGPLYGKSSTGKIKIWEITINLEDNGQVKLITNSGYENGKKTNSTREIKGKNTGRANETTPWNQAILEATSKMNKKKDEGYVENKDDLKDQDLLLPMLAHSYTKRKHDIVWPAIVQPKLNGVRCLTVMTENSLEYLSRKGKKYSTLRHLDECTKALISELGVPLDGEVFVKDWTFQEIVRAIKKDRGKVTDQLQYWIYDIVDTNSTFEERLEKMILAHSKLIKLDAPVKLTPYFIVKNEEEMMERHKIWTAQGFEGTIARNIKGKYVIKNRSKDLQKYKDFKDSEYEITGGTEATGNDSGTVIFTCKTLQGKEFSVRPMGSRERRREWLRDIDLLVGKKLIVKYQELSENGTPIFPVGVEIRDFE